MSENDAERLTRLFFESQAFQVERIPTATGEQRADYRVSDANHTYVVEVKGRIEDDDYAQELWHSGKAFREDALGRINAVSRRIRDAAQQLAATPTDATSFRIITLAAVGDDPETQATQFQATLYGIVDLLTPAEDGSARARPCFYFSFSEFFILRHVDAALILLPSGSRICLNSYGLKVEAFRQTALYQLHESHGAVADPERMEVRQEAFIADCNLDRRDESALLAYIKQKYTLDQVITFNPRKYTASKIVPRG